MRMFGLELELSGWRCLGYTVLGTHYHVAIRLTELTLSSGFQRLNSRYARWYNAEHGRRGALWQSRFFDAVVETEWHLLELQRYIAYNAPRANLAERPEDWPHCSYGALIGLYPPDPWVDETTCSRRSDRTKSARVPDFACSSKSAIPAFAAGGSSEEPQRRRRETASSCSSPFVVTRLLRSVGAAPSKVVARPPASSTRSCTAL
jgi:hypothetical protein